MINRIEIIPNKGYGIYIKKDREIVGWVTNTINGKYCYIYQGNKSSETFDTEAEAVKVFL